MHTSYWYIQPRPKEKSGSTILHVFSLMTVNLWCRHWYIDDYLRRASFVYNNPASVQLSSCFVTNLPLSKSISTISLVPFSLPISFFSSPRSSNLCPHIRLILIYTSCWRVTCSTKQATVGTVASEMSLQATNWKTFLQHLPKTVLCLRSGLKILIFFTQSIIFIA